MYKTFLSSFNYYLVKQFKYQTTGVHFLQVNCDAKILVLTNTQGAIGSLHLVNTNLNYTAEKYLKTVRPIYLLACLINRQALGNITQTSMYYKSKSIICKFTLVHLSSGYCKQFTFTCSSCSSLHLSKPSTASNPQLCSVSDLTSGH